MPRAISLTRRAAVKAERIVDAITLDHRARALAGGSGKLRADGGLDIDLALPAPAVANNGDALKLEDGSLVVVRAAAERVLEVRAENPVRLLRAALLAGGAHAVAEAGGDVLYLQASDAVAEAIRGLGCAVTAIERPFSPERLAVHDCCGHDHHDHHGHGDGHDHGHGCCGHDHGHNHAHGHDHNHSHGHGEDCGCSGGKRAHDHG